MTEPAEDQIPTRWILFLGLFVNFLTALALIFFLSLSGCGIDVNPTIKLDLTGVPLADVLSELGCVAPSDTDLSELIVTTTHGELPK